MPGIGAINRSVSDPRLRSLAYASGYEERAGIKKCATGFASALLAEGLQVAWAGNSFAKRASDGSTHKPPVVKTLA